MNPEQFFRKLQSRYTEETSNKPTPNQIQRAITNSEISTNPLIGASIVEKYGLGNIFIEREKPLNENEINELSLSLIEFKKNEPEAFLEFHAANKNNFLKIKDEINTFKIAKVCNNRKF